MQGALGLQKSVWQEIAYVEVCKNEVMGASMQLTRSSLSERLCIAEMGTPAARARAFSRSEVEMAGLQRRTRVLRALVEATLTPKLVMHTCHSLVPTHELTEP